MNKLIYSCISCILVGTTSSVSATRLEWANDVAAIVTLQKADQRAINGSMSMRFLGESVFITKISVSCGCTAIDAPSGALFNALSVGTIRWSLESHFVTSDKRVQIVIEYLDAFGDRLVATKSVIVRRTQIESVLPRVVYLAGKRDMEVVLNTVDKDLPLDRVIAYCPRGEFAPVIGRANSGSILVNLLNESVKAEGVLLLIQIKRPDNTTDNVLTSVHSRK